MLPTAADAYSAAGVDESYMLPMAVRFGGSPVVTAEGNIVYHFEVQCAVLRSMLTLRTS
jgi:hypothetical protein